jgi:hypothetical protein
VHGGGVEVEYLGADTGAVGNQPVGDGGQGRVQQGGDAERVVRPEQAGGVERIKGAGLDRPALLALGRLGQCLLLLPYGWNSMMKRIRPVSEAMVTNSRPMPAMLTPYRMPRSCP